MNPTLTPVGFILRLAVVISLYALAVLALLAAVAFPAHAQDDSNAWIGEALKQQRKAQYRKGYAYDGDTPVLSRRQALKRSTIEVVEVKTRVLVRKVPEHYEAVLAVGGPKWGRKRQSLGSLGSDKRGAGPGPVCKGWTRVMGWPANTQKGAKVYADRMWFYTVQNDHGGQYANLDLAKDAKRFCGPQAVTQFAKRVLWICIIAGTPCRATEGEPVGDKARKKQFDKDDIEVGE